MSDGWWHQKIMLVLLLPMKMNGDETAFNRQKPPLLQKCKNFLCSKKGTFHSFLCPSFSFSLSLSSSLIHYFSLTSLYSLSQSFSLTTVHPFSHSQSTFSYTSFLFLFLSSSATIYHPFSLSNHICMGFLILLA